LEAVVEQWVDAAISSWDASSQEFLRGKRDSFRNPVGHAVRENLSILLREVLGQMRAEVIGPTIDALVCIRAMQQFATSESVGFVIALRNILQRASGTVNSAIDERIDALALQAFDQYMNCREQIFALRAKDQQMRAQIDQWESGERA